MADLRVHYTDGVESQEGVRRAVLTGAILALALIVVIIAEINWPTQLQFGQAKPDLMLLLVLYCAFSGGPAAAMGVGFAGGLLQDTFSAVPLGLNVFCKVLIGYVVGMVGRRLVTEHPIVMTLIVFVASLCEAALVVLLSFLYEDHVSVKFMFLHIGVPMAFYNSILAPLCFYCADRLRVKLALPSVRRTKSFQSE
jgi:rod shape-determining protein MreD